jgi:predicted ArsR family transcriptional regulator
MSSLSQTKRATNRLAERNKVISQLCEYAREHQAFTLQEAAIACGLHPVTAGKHLVALSDAGRLRRRIVRTVERQVQFEYQP